MIEFGLNARPPKKTPLGTLTQGVRKQPYSNPAFFTPNGHSPMVLRRHFSVTLPLR